MSNRNGRKPISNKQLADSLSGERQIYSGPKVDVSKIDMSKVFVDAPKNLIVGVV